MKIVKNLAFLFIATLLVGFSFTSCSDDDDDINVSHSDLIGSWQVVSSEGYTKMAGMKVDNNNNDEELLTFTFNEDGTFILITEEEWNGKMWRYEDGGTWSLKGDKLTIKYDDDDDENNFPEKITKITSSELVTVISEKGKYEGIPYEFYKKTIYTKVSN